MSKGKEFSFLVFAEEFVEKQIQKIVLSAYTEMKDINLNPQAYPLERKLEVKNTLNWGRSISHTERGDYFSVFYLQGQGEDDAGIYLKRRSE